MKRAADTRGAANRQLPADAPLLDFQQRTEP